MPGNHIDLVTFDLPRELSRRLAGDDPLAELLCHVLRIARMHIQLMRDLAVRKIQSHKIEAQNPNLQRLMMPFEERAGEVIEVPVADSTPIALPLGLGVVPTMFGHRIGSTMRTAHPLGPAHLTNGLETLGIVNECLDIQ
jgi:hypothetical protein